MLWDAQLGVIQKRSVMSYRGESGRTLNEPLYVLIRMVSSDQTLMLYLTAWIRPHQCSLGSRLGRTQYSLQVMRFRCDACLVLQGAQPAVSCRSRNKLAGNRNGKS